jgi:putative Mg2+ transporter-C (MgtC) family protein
MSDWEIAVKLLLACLCGGIIGYSREKEKKAAGLRTNIMVCLGSTLFTVLSIGFGQKYPGTDMARIASNIVTGIGFIGAGTILQAGGSVIGITTAASIWTVAAIGMALGASFYLAAGMATLLSFLVLWFLHKFEKKYIRGEEP